MKKRDVNAGKYDKKIQIVKMTEETDANGFPIDTPEVVLKAYASVNTTRGYLLIKNNSDFEKAYTNFTIRYPKVAITKEMLVLFRNKTYTIEYLNDVDEDNIELEIQCKEVTH
jgi:SPP1 family predicted phage head-tail adaptor